jgi:DNA-binding beta-propeller fold protein YncE
MPGFLAAACSTAADILRCGGALGRRTVEQAPVDPNQGRRACVAGLGVVLAAATLVTAPGARADTSTQLSLTSFGALVVDDVDGYVFVSGGAGSSALEILDIDGNLVTTIGLSGPSGMAFDPASSTLYVAEAGASTLAIIDAATPQKTGSISVAPTAAPRQLALAGGRLWFSHDCAGPGLKVASIRTDGGDIRTYPGSNFPSFCAVFAVSTDGNTLVVGDTDVSPTTIHAYDVSTDPPTLLSGAWNAGNTNFLEQLVVSTDGASVFSAAAWPHGAQRLSLSDYAVEASYATPNAANSLALTTDGAYLAVGRGGTSGADVFVYRTETGAFLRTFELGSKETLQPRGLAFSADASKLFAATRDAASGKIVLRALGAPTVTPAPTSVSLAASASKLKYNRTVRLTAHVTGATTGSVSIYATPHGEARQFVATGPVDASGNFSASWVMKQKTTFRAEYEGDAEHAVSVSAGRVVSVYAIATVRMTNYYGISGKYRLYRSGRYPTAVGTVVPNHQNLTLEFVAQRYSDGAWRTIARRTLYIDATGSIAVYLRATTRANYRMRSVFAGDTDHLGDQSPWAYFRIT